MPPNLSLKTIPPKYAFLQNLSVGLDVVLIVAWAVVALLYAMTVGKRKGPILLLSTYAGLSVAIILSKSTILLSDSLESLQGNEFFLLGVFILVSLLAFVALMRVLRFHGRAVSRNWLLIMGILESGAFFASIGYLLPTDLQKLITGFGALLFTTSWSHVLWLILPLVLFLVSEHRTE